MTRLLFQIHILAWAICEIAAQDPGQVWTANHHRPHISDPAPATADDVNRDHFDPSRYQPMPTPQYRSASLPPDPHHQRFVSFNLVSGAQTTIVLPDLTALKSQIAPGRAHTSAFDESMFDAWGNLAQVSSTGFPWSTQARVFFNRGGTPYSCSGTLIDQRVVITAAHCLHAGGPGGALSTNVRVAPAWDGSDDAYGMARATQTLVTQGWIATGSFDHDVGLIILDRPVGSLTGWLGYGYNTSNQFFRNNTFDIAGYPGDLSCWPGAPHQLFHGSGTYDQVRTFTLQANTPWNCSTDGTSGAGVYHLDLAAGRIVYGAHSYAAQNFSYWGQARMTQAYFSQILNSVIPGSLPSQLDLVALNARSPSPSTPSGCAMLSLDYIVTNSSLADVPPQTYTVDVYLSQDSFITTQDQLIQTHTFTWDFDPKSTVRINVSSPPVIPATTHPGTYSVGVIVNLADADPINNATSGWDAARVRVPSSRILNVANGHFYERTCTTMTWTEAQREARVRGGKLVTIDDAAENSWVAANFAQSSSVWIGLNDETFEGDFAWDSGARVVYTSWGAGEPNNAGNEDYVFLRDNGSWNDSQNLSGLGPLFGVIEYGPEPLLLEAEQVSVGPNGHTYHCLSPSTWTRAEGAAGMMGGHLVTINDAAENEWVRSTFHNAGTSLRDHLWIGLTDLRNEGTFEWSSGQAVTYTNWRAGEPNNAGNEDYTLMYGRPPGEWNDLTNTSQASIWGIVESDSPTPRTIRTLAHPVSGHIYYLLSASSWETAEQHSVALGGHLATINDAAEADWIYREFLQGESRKHLWIGLSDSHEEGRFRWASGESVTYTDWARLEPNNVGGESYAHMDAARGSRWNDNVNQPIGWIYFGLAEVCPSGQTSSYGVGCAGSGGIVPELTLDACPARGGQANVRIEEGLGGALSFLAIGGGRTSQPLLGSPCTQLIFPVSEVIPIFLSGSGAGAGSAVLPLSVPASFPPTTVTLQAAVLDTTAPGNLATTNGLELVLR